MAITVRELVTKLRVDGDKATEKLAKFGLAVDGVRAGIGILVGTFNTARRATFDFVRDQTAAADRIAKSARTIGASGEEYQRLEFAATRSGASMGSMQRAVRTLARNLRDASRGEGKQFQEAIAEIGLTSRDFVGLDLEGKIGLIGDAMNEHGDRIDKVALSQRIFGERAGPELATLLGEGEAGVRALGDEAERLGLILDEDALKAAEAYQDALTNLDGVVQGIKRSIAAELAPAMQVIIDRFRKWIEENRKLIKQKIQKFFDAVIRVTSMLMDRFEEFAELGTTIFEMMETLVDVFMSFADSVGGVENAVKLATIAILAMQGALVAGPWGAAVLAIGGIALAFGDVETSADKARIATERFGRVKAPNKIGKEEKDRLASRTLESLKRTKDVSPELLNELAGLDRIDLLDVQRRVRRGAQMSTGAIGKSGQRIGGGVSEKQVKQLAELIKLQRETIASNEKATKKQTSEFEDLFGRVNEVTGSPSTFTGGGGGGGGKGKKADEELSQEELLKLIDTAASTGQSLTGMIGKRRIEGGTPPVIAVRIQKTTVNQNITANTEVNGADSATVEELADLVQEKQAEAYRREIDEAMQEMQPAFAR